MATPQEQLALIRKFGIEDDYEGAIKIKDVEDEDGNWTWHGSVDAATVEWLIERVDQLDARAIELQSSESLELTRLRAEVEGLREIVGRLHKDANGNPVAPGDSLWHPRVKRLNGNLAELIYRSGDRPVLRRKRDINDGIKTHVVVWECYSTREAAQEATQ